MSEVFIPKLQIEFGLNVVLHSLEPNLIDLYKHETLQRATDIGAVAHNDWRRLGENRLRTTIKSQPNSLLT